MKRIQGVLALALAAFATGASAGEFNVANLQIVKIRAVGNYSGTTFDDTVELWFPGPLNWPAASGCDGASYRVYVDASKKHLVAAAYMALAMNKPVTISIDNTLPIRSGSCEVAYLDVGN